MVILYAINLLKAALKGKEYDFDSMFDPLKGIFRASDFVIGALETTFSGEHEGYNSRPFAYNSPDEWLKASIIAGQYTYNSEQSLS